MERTRIPEAQPKATIQTEAVKPQTLTIKPMPFRQGSVETVFFGVFGGPLQDVWVAAFFDLGEAQAWRIGQRYSGAPVNGGVMGERSTNRIISTDAGDGRGRSGGEARQPGNEGRSGSADQLPPDQTPLSGGSEVGNGGAGATASTAPASVLEEARDGGVGSDVEGSHSDVAARPDAEALGD
jgi:hypothetical protein